MSDRSSESIGSRQLREDQKTLRKLRKQLRQIEHLELLSRHLNDEEAAKLARRDEYRAQLDELTSAYPNNELSLLADHGNEATVDISDLAEIEESHDYVDDDSLGQLVEGFKKLGCYDEQQVLGAGSKSDEEADAKTGCSQVLKKAEIQDTDKLVDEKITSQTEVGTKSEPPKRRKKSTKKSAITFDIVSERSAHADLITTVDVCLESQIIVTGSRDTTLKIWRFSKDEMANSCALVQSLGGHRNSITRVKFLPRSEFEQSLARLEASTDNDMLVDQLTSNRDRETQDDEHVTSKLDQWPLIISSSLDCSFRLWSRDEQIGCVVCLKEFYLYNPINYFDLRQTQLVFAMDAGKIEYWKDFKSCCVKKTYQDTDRVVCVRFGDSKIFSMSQFGLLNIFTISSDSEVNMEKQIDLFERLKTPSMNRNFKSFVLLNNENSILTFNDNKPFVTLFNLDDDSLKFISTSTSNHCLTTCLYRDQNCFYIGSYSIDTGTSIINVFEIMSENSETLVYKFSLENPEKIESRRSISALCASSSSVIVSGSSASLSVWLLDDSKNEKRRVRANRAGQKQMFEIKESSWKNDDELTSSECESNANETTPGLDDESDNKHRNTNDENESSREECETTTKSKCNVQ